jgi:ribosome-interacting GTPase 1
VRLFNFRENNILVSMPANLTPQYLEAEARFKRAGTPQEKIDALGKEPDFTEPVILKRKSTVEEVALSVHKDFAGKLRYARIRGSGKFDGQMVKRDYRVGEGDVIELHI